MGKNGRNASEMSRLGMREQPQISLRFIEHARELSQVIAALR